MYSGGKLHAFCRSAQYTSHVPLRSTAGTHDGCKAFPIKALGLREVHDVQQHLRRTNNRIHGGHWCTLFMQTYWFGCSTSTVPVAYRHRLHTVYVHHVDEVKYSTIYTIVVNIYACTSFFGIWNSEPGKMWFLLAQHDNSGAVRGFCLLL